MPNDPTTPGGGTQPPYYLTMSMPGYTAPEYSLTTSFVAKGRENVAAFMAVDSNPLSPGYGTIRILELPRSTVISGPEPGAEHVRVLPDRVAASSPCTARAAQR